MVSLIPVGIIVPVLMHCGVGPLLMHSHAHISVRNNTQDATSANSSHSVAPLRYGALKNVL
jgi:hypothetical protein